MKRQTVVEIALFVLLVAVGAAVRISLQELPNFAPVAALALFSGYFFRSRLVALAVPISIMLLSDSVIGHYAWWQMVVVYSMLALPVAMRGLLRRQFKFENAKVDEVARSLAGLLGCSLFCSVLFFIATNACCLGWYEPTWTGVVQCYAQALPFFRFTLYGDIAFAVLTFGSYATIVGLFGAADSQAKNVGEPKLIGAAE